VTNDNGTITEEFDTDPMTTAEQRAEADALALIPDDQEM
jgi:hypothetical protein